MRPAFFSAIVASVASLAATAPAVACTPAVKTPAQLERSATLAVLAKIRIATTTLSDSEWIGTAALDVVKVVRNQRSIAVPRIINVAFTLSLDAEDCGRWIPDGAATLYSLDVEDGRFVVRMALR